jgi:hypothetical protein
MGASFLLTVSPLEELAPMRRSYGFAGFGTANPADRHSGGSSLPPITGYHEERRPAGEAGQGKNRWLSPVPPPRRPSRPPATTR